MANIVITTFGGELPSVSARALPDLSARTARNLLPTTDEFRPVAAELDVATSSVVNPRTIYRMSRVSGGAFNTNMTTGWLANAGEVRYVKGQLNDDATERTYYTLPDAPPRAMDVNGNDRRLGVPRPSEAPGLAVDAGYTYTQDEKDKDVSATSKAVRDAILAAAPLEWIGAPVTARGVDDSFLAAGSDFSLSGRTYGLTNGAVTDPFSDVAASKFTWVFDPALGGYATSTRYVIPYYSKAKTYRLNRLALKAALEAIKRPLSDPPENIIPSDVAEELTVQAEKTLTSASPAVKEMLDAHKKLRDEVEALLAGGSDANMVSSLNAFYLRASVQSAINAAISTFASDVFNRAKWVVDQSNVDYAGAQP